MRPAIFPDTWDQPRDVLDTTTYVDDDGVERYEADDSIVDSEPDWDNWSPGLRWH